jgi:DNA-binding response OmpR family regulator
MSPRKILVVDDDPSIREILSIQLTRLGYEITTADDGIEAVAAFKASAPDAILMDLMMPRLDGLASCQQIRAVEKKTGAKRTPILFLTARDSTHDKTSAALSGGDEFVAKPVSMQELRDRLEALFLKKGKA